MPFTKLISVVKVIAFIKQSCLLGEMFYEFESEMFEVYFSAEKQVIHDNKMI